MNYNNKKFRIVDASENSETRADTIFLYKQEGQILTSEFQSDSIVKGFLIGLVGPKGKINMAYQLVNKLGQLRTGTCESIPERMNNGKIRLHETWQWTSGDQTSGKSVLEEI